MSGKMKNIILIVQSVLLLIIIIVGLIYFGPKVINKINGYLSRDQYVSVNDNLSDLPFTNTTGEKAEFGDKYKFVIYISKDCSSCLSHMFLMKRLNETFCKDQDVELMLMWIDEAPPMESLEYLSLEDCSYILDNYRMSDSYNTAFLLDQNNNVIFTEKSDYGAVTDKIIELGILDTDKLITNSNIYITENLAKNYGDKPNFIYFSMPGCPDCADANPIIFSDEIADKVFMTRIELVRGAESYDIKDEFNLFKKIYSIDWYPSFLIINNDGSWDIVRKVEVADMKEIILSKLP